MGKKYLLVLLITVVLMMLIVGCGGSINLEPRAIDPTLDICPICRMSIVDLHFTAQIIDNDGLEESFDDIGCLILYLKRLGTEGQQGILATYVKDFQSTQWLSAREASYVQGRIDTPMSFGIVAFETQAAAEEMANKIDGKVITWEEALEVQLSVGFEIETEEEQGAETSRR